MSKLKLEMNLALPALEDFQPLQLPEECWKILQACDLEPLKEFEGINIAENREKVKEKMEEMDSSMVMHYFQSEKIEKLCLGWTVIMKSIVVTMFSGWPRNDYDFPATPMDMVESEKHVYIGADLIPLTDIVINDWYREKYLDGFEPLYRQYLDLSDPTPNPMNWFRALSSPYVISGRPDVGKNRGTVKRAAECFMAYIKYWLEEIVAKAEPMQDPAHKEYVNKKKTKIRDEFRRKDPGGPPLVMSLGKELAWETVKLIF
jgi:hypothetical protein